jgi:hypothetical protein
MWGAGSSAVPFCFIPHMKPTREEILEMKADQLRSQAEHKIESAQFVLSAIKTGEPLPLYLAKLLVQAEAWRDRFMMLFSIALLFIIASLLERIF